MVPSPPMAGTSLTERAVAGTVEAPGAHAARTAREVHSALSTFRHGRGDPTTQLSPPGAAGEFRRATHTPDGPGTIRITWRRTDASSDVVLDVDTWGPGGTWLVAQADAMTGALDRGDPSLEQAPHVVVARAARDGRHVRFGRSADLYHELLPTIIEQRITSGEAVRQWARLCRELGAPAPGPFPELLTPPPAPVLRRQPSWWFHPLGVERTRAQTLIEVARHASTLWSWTELPPADAEQRLQLLRGVGRWTTGSVLGPALGDPDALCVGDYHAKNVVSWALHGRPRGTDEEMLESLRPYAGQRGRVLRLLGSAGITAPKFGPRRRLLPMERW